MIQKFLTYYFNLLVYSDVPHSCFLVFLGNHTVFGHFCRSDYSL